MYTPPAFVDSDRDAMHALIRASRLALLVSAGEPGAVPDATHLPLMIDAGDGDGEYGTLVGHFARANTHWRRLAAAGQALAIFSGPEAYVSPGFYPAKAEHGKVVPTWNYVVVHASGPVEIFDDRDRLHAVVSRLTDHHERQRDRDWQVADAPPEFTEAQLRGIVGFSLRIAVLEGKRKLNQNRSLADRAGVVAGLDASGNPADLALAAEMRAL